MNSKILSNVSSHSMLLKSCFKAIITFVFQVPGALTGPKQMPLKCKLLWKNLSVILGELFASYCKRGHLWKLLLLLVLLLLFRLQWLTACFRGTEKNILLLRLLLLWRKATHVFYFILQCLMQLCMHLHCCYLCICRHFPLENSGVCEFLHIPFNIQS